MRWIYLSPHFDDVVLSCGGMVWEQVQAGQVVEVWTICAGAPDPKSALSPFAQLLHERWGVGLEAVPARRLEDEAAVARLGAAARYWTLPDCIYRPLPNGEWLVNGQVDLWQPVHPQEAGVVERLAGWLAAQLTPQDVLVSPLTLGNHVDHRLVRAGAEHASAQVGCALLYYPDYPYAVKPGTEWAGKTGPGWQKDCRAISAPALAAWQESLACYISQISTFWSGRAEMNAALADYLQSGGGACLWRADPGGKPAFV